jgi:hypothetical protein
MARLTDCRPVLQSEPLPVIFTGFYSNTHELGRWGWRLALDEGFRRDDPFHRARNALLHHDKLGVTLVGDLYGEDDLLRGRREYHHPYGGSGYRENEESFHRRRYEDGPRIEIRSAGKVGQMPIMMAPSGLNALSWRSTESTHTDIAHPRELHELPLFAQLYPDTQELIVEPQSVQALLDQILAQQGPMRKEIRARDARRDRASGAKEARQVHAQIVSLAAA